MSKKKFDKNLEFKKTITQVIEKFKNLGLNNHTRDFRLKTFLDSNGDFDYDAYVQIQTMINKKKINFKGPAKTNLKKLTEHMVGYIGINNIKFGLCHGTRRGTEQMYFTDLLNKAGGQVDVIGTEISDTAVDFPNTIQWDFHHIKDEWIDNISFIFSNSLDHSYHPILCLSQWMKCLQPGGIIYLQRGIDDLPKTFMGDQWKDNDGIRPDEEFPADAFQSTHEVFENIIIPQSAKLAGKNIKIERISYPEHPAKNQKLKFLKNSLRNINKKKADFFYIAIINKGKIVE